MSSTESEPFQDSGSEYCPSDLDQPSTSRGCKKKKSKKLVQCSVYQPSRSPDKTTNNTKDRRVRKSVNGLREKRGRKRLRNESGWRKNIRKSLKTCGEEHINSVNKVVPKRVVGAPCNCPRKCFEKVTELHRNSVLTSFNQLGNKEKQDIYLAGLISSKAVARKRPSSGQGKEKNVSFSYKIRFGLIEQQVCKKAFYGVHGITKHRVDRIASFLKSNVTAPPDMRGKHKNRPSRIPEEIVQNIETHITSFPRRSSHYSRDKNERKYYLPSDLNISKMHLMYLEKYENEIFSSLQKGEKVHPKVTYDFYNRYFVSNHNISFGTPRSDTCQTCDRLQNCILAELNPETKTALLTEKSLHIRKAEMFYQKLKEVTALAKEDVTIEVLCFDFEQNLPLPHVPAGDVFYKRQLWQYNFCIHSAKTSISTFYMYDEQTAKKGSNEVISFLDHYIKTFLTNSVKMLYIFSDNAFAQNKNQTLTKYLYTLVNINKNIHEIFHQYPEPGHSFLPCDRSFGLIEKNKRKKERIYLPSEWRKLVQETSKNFRVVPVEQNMILNFADHFKQVFKSSFIGLKKEKFAISTYRIMKYTQNNNFIECSVSSGLYLFTKFCIKQNGNTQLWMPDIKAYSRPLQINPKKIKDLKTLVSKYVPSIDQPYYNELFENNNDAEVEEGSIPENTQDEGNVSDSSYV